jgi:hypothetical protein
MNGSQNNPAEDYTAGAMLARRHLAYRSHMDAVI